MTYDQVMKSLSGAGKEQYRKIFLRHGATEPLFGVSFAHLYTLVKQITQDQPLAQKLWDSGNYDAKLLATMIADPSEMDGATLDKWSRDVDSPPVADAFAKLVAKTEHAGARMRKWIASSDDFIGQSGWTLVAPLAINGSLPDKELQKLLVLIEKKIAAAKNRTKYAMNNALIAIGGSSGDGSITKLALDAAKRIGKVEVDHGETGCKTPDAIPYIQKMLNHRAGKKPRVRC